MAINLRNLCLVLGSTIALSACGGGGGGEAPQRAAQESAGTSPQQLSGGVCGLLTREQVNTVIPGNDGGREQDASEAALLKDVEMEHCRYFFIEGTNPKWLDLLIYKASSAKGFEQIDIGEWAHKGTSRRLDFGDIGFLHDMSEQNEMVATASKGKTVFELKLNADDAKSRSEQLIDLARIVAGKI
jgi:hypothetical protein